MFEGKSKEEIAAMSRPVDLDELMAEDPELAEALMRTIASLDEDTPTPRTLQ